MQRPSPARSRAARRRFLESGVVDPAVFDPAVCRSWQRSRDFGLPAAGAAPGVPHASRAQLVRALEEQRDLVSHARPVMEFVFEQTRASQSMVILSDMSGMLLHALGDADFLERAMRVALRPGANWSEQWRGTNAIGTALAECAPVVVHGAEHYLERNGFLTCTAAPIFDPTGRPLGVFDISGERRTYHPHTLGLVRSAVRMIEHRLFDTRHGGGLRLRLHAHAEGLGTLTEGLLALDDEGLLALDDDGRIVGADPAAVAILGLRRDDITSTTVDRVLSLDAGALRAMLGRADSAPRLVHRPDGSELWMRPECGRRPVAVSRSVPARVSSDALDALDTGDETLRTVLSRARRVADKPIALLVLGESGVGKEVLARAVHASSARRNGRFVAVNCAALPETLIEAELFGYSPGAFTGANRDGAPGRIREADGGTLFLDEIGDMPLSMQARLLRVLQERQVQPLGGGRAVPVDFRLVCATHHDLRASIAAGRFREDLYYRLNGLVLSLPPLRRRGDLAALAQATLRELSPDAEIHIAPDVARAMAHYRWPGNLRQLTSALQTAIALLADDESVIDWPHLPDDLVDDLRVVAAGPADVAEEPAPPVRCSARDVREALERVGGNRSLAARALGISRNTLYRRLREHAPD